LAVQQEACQTAVKAVLIEFCLGLPVPYGVHNSPDDYLRPISGDECREFFSFCMPEKNDGFVKRIYLQ